MKENWDNFWSSSERNNLLIPSHSKKRIIRILKKYLQPGMKALDAGCGSGFFTNFFVNQGIETTALDYSLKAIDIAKEISGGKARYITADLVDEHLPDVLGTRYDLIFTDGLFEHFPLDDQKKIMENFIRLKSPDGIIATFVPNLFSPWQLIRPFLMPGIKEKPFTLMRLCSISNGLVIKEKGGLNVFPFFLSPEFVFGRLFGMILYTIAK